MQRGQEPIILHAKMLEAFAGILVRNPNWKAQEEAQRRFLDSLDCTESNRRPEVVLRERRWVEGSTSGAIPDRGSLRFGEGRTSEEF